MDNVFLGRVTPLLKKGALSPLQESDVPMVPELERTAAVQKVFEEMWAKEVIMPLEKRSLWRALLRSVGLGQLAVGLLLAGVSAGGAIGPPLILKAFSDHFSGQYVLKDSVLWILVALLLVLPTCSSVCMAHSYVIFSHAACMVRNILTPTVYAKALRIGSNSKLSFSSGKIINLFSIDVFHIHMFFQMFGGEVFAPAQLGMALGLVYREVGVAMFAALGFVVAILPLLIITFILFAMYRRLKNIPGDSRVKLTNEVLSGIRIIKYYSWERPFFAKIDALRTTELSYLLKMNLVLVLIVMLITSIPFVLPIVIFYTYTNINNKQLDVGKAFTTLALLGLVSGPMTMIPAFIQRYFQARISMTRIYEFLSCDELEQYITFDSIATSEQSGCVISLRDASLGWINEPTAGATSGENAKDATKYESLPADASTVGIELTEKLEGAAVCEELINRSANTLINVNLSVQEGELVAIIGGVGSGKSSLLCALLGDLQLRTGSVSVRRSRIAYHAQQSWIINTTVKDNIIFGLPFDEDRFERAVQASCLSSDLAILPRGVDTEIGEKGINLSGGQKARVSFARAVYRDADIYLLDDPLSAVDAHVGVHLFEKGIRGALKGKTIILVTHQVHLLDECDKIVIMKGGLVHSQGSPDDIRRAGVDVNEVVVKTVMEPPLTDGSPRSRFRTLSAVSDVGRLPTDEPTFRNERATSDATASADVVGHADAQGQRSRANSLTSEAIEFIAHTQNPETSIERAIDATTRAADDIIELFKSDSAKSIVTAIGADLDSRGAPPVGYEALMTTEERSVGDVSLAVYAWYARLGGRGAAALSFVISLIGAAGFTYSSFWLADWGDATTKSYEEDYKPLSQSENNYYLNIYAALCCIAVLASCSRTSVLVFFGVAASRKMHNMLLDGILRSPVSFFDSTPLGRILNRFTSDVTNTDESLATNISFTLAMQASILAAIGAICYSTTGVLSVLFLPLSIIFWKIQFFFRQSNTELKRLDNISRSPIYAQFDQALVGVTSMRAYAEIPQFLMRLETSVDLNSSVIVLQQLIKWWISIRLEIIGGLVSCVIAALAVGWDGFLSDKYLSMSLNFSFALVSNMKWLVSISAEVEANMSSVERIKFYSDNLAEEEPEERRKLYKPVPPDWPKQGRVEARGVEMAYRTGPLVLKGVNFDVSPSEKIGIAGRTGCGKSSLMVALFRIENLRRGSIVIDGVDISTVALHDLRPRLGIIPQDAVIFSVTVRFNLDPFNEYSDAEIWDVLDSVDMKDAILSLPNKLLEAVSDGGESFSAGQKQLICIARVLLRKPKILVLDEATASVDNNTDALIQDMVRNKFKECTILTIAHRLHTVIDSDRLMVLSEGNLIEFDSPKALLERPEGIFAALWKQHNESRANNDSENGKN